MIDRADFSPTARFGTGVECLGGQRAEAGARPDKTKEPRMPLDPPTQQLPEGAVNPAGSWIQRSPHVCGGDACIRNTRHTVWGLVDWRKQGASDSRILQHHPDLSPADLRVAWAYYEAHRDEIDRAIQENEEA
jgi:uncharacterized protein (DUF433 family)